MSRDVRTAPHPFVWTVLYLPFGAMSGFVTVALTFLATQHGLSISEGALLNGAQMGTQWLKWLWAPVIDVTLTPRKWYVISTAASALGIVGMSVIPLAPDTLGLLLAVIAAASIINSNVGMAVEAIISAATEPEDAGRVSAWFQAGNLGGQGVGGALGLFLLIKLPAPWMGGTIMGTLMMLCCLALLFTPKVAPGHAGGGVAGAVKGVVGDLKRMFRTQGGVLAAVICALPIGSGAAQPVLTQAEVAAFWGAGAHEVELMQGLLSGFVTTLGCFGGGWLCARFRPRVAYAAIGILMAVVSAGMALSPANVSMYVVWNLAYAFVLGLAYASFTATVLQAMGAGSGATKYNLYASLANFPIWWLGLVLGVAAQRWGPRRMLLVEALFGVLGVAIFGFASRRVARSKLPETE